MNRRTDYFKELDKMKADIRDLEKLLDGNPSSKRWQELKVQLDNMKAGRAAQIETNNKNALTHYTELKE
jgi:hypothetical protein